MTTECEYGACMTLKMHQLYISATAYVYAPLCETDARVF